VAFGDAWLGSEVGWVKVHSASPDGPVEWFACAAAWLTPDASAIIAGDAAATNVIASKASIFDFMFFLPRLSGPMAYESRVLNASTIDRFTRKAVHVGLHR